MKNKYFKILLLGALLLAFVTVGLAQKSKRPKKPQTMIESNDFKPRAPVNTAGGKKRISKKNRVSKKKKKAKRWRKLCWTRTVTSDGKTYREEKCRNVSY